MLVATKKDLRDDPAAVQRLQMNGMEPTTYDQGAGLCREIGGARFIECSALTQENLKEIFDTSIRVVLDAMKRASSGGKSKKGKMNMTFRCAIM